MHHDDLIWARVLMGTTLGLHIIYAVVSIGLPVVVAIAHGWGLRRKDDRLLALARSLTRVVVLLFALGAATGMVISFELSLLWPRFMAIAGPVVAGAFSIELIAFFLEAIFLALYVYGRDRIRNPWLHWACLIPVSIGAVASGILIVLINGWMNVPAGVTIRDGRPINVHPVQALFRYSTFVEVLHVALTAYLVTAGVLASVAGLGVLLKRGRPGQARLALNIAVVLAAVMVVPVIVSGDMQAKAIGFDQPEKLAAAEALFETGPYAPERLGGIVDSAGHLHGAITAPIPGLLSYLDKGDRAAVVQGLSSYPKNSWPPLFVHYTWQIMVGAGFVALVIAFGGAYALFRRRRLPERGVLLLSLISLGPLTIAAMECGWMLTCIGRQPWVIYHMLTTRDAVTGASGIPWVSVGFLLLWGFISVGTLVVLRFLLRREEESAAPDSATPAAPTAGAASAAA